MVGVGILALSLVFTGFLGILQDLSYRKFGQHWQEALFYAVWPGP
jgi:solute carrier family 35 (UDP-xylose/UDP-N-acetylglucosamine transporter), member B4